MGPRESTQKVLQRTARNLIFNVDERRPKFFNAHRGNFGSSGMAHEQEMQKDSKSLITIYSTETWPKTGSPRRRMRN